MSTDQSDHLLKPEPGRRLGVGIDFGTTNSAAALFDGVSLITIPLEEDGDTIPSANYVDRSFSTRTGQQAIDAYISGNVGRKVELTAEVLGEARTSTGQLDDTGIPTVAETRTIFGRVIEDRGLQGRLFRGVKRLLGDGRLHHLTVFDRPFRLVALVTPLLVRIRSTVQEFADIFTDSDAPALTHACIGHPVKFEGSDRSGNDIALSRLTEAYRHAGIVHQTLCPEPIAASLSYLHEHRGPSVRTVMTVDFGGGTLDICFVRSHPDHSFTIEGVHGVGLGGDHIDQRLYRSLIFPLLGQGERYVKMTDGGERIVPFPMSDYEPLLINWVMTYMLNQGKYLTPIVEGIRQGGAAAEKFRRLLDLIRLNHNYLVFQAIASFKAALSHRDQAVLDIPELDIRLSLTRKEFEVLIAEELLQFEAAIHEALARSNLQADAIDLVLRTGGSSLIPAVERILEKHFPGRVVRHDPLTSVANGLAIAGYNGFDFAGSVRQFYSVAAS